MTMLDLVFVLYSNSDKDCETSIAVFCKFGTYKT